LPCTSITALCALTIAAEYLIRKKEGLDLCLKPRVNLER